jgi:hypothetical protein
MKAMRRAQIGFGIAMATMLGLTGGCEHGGGGLSWGFGRPKGEPWTILCVAISGPGRIAESELLAEDVRKIQGVQSQQVKVRHGRNSSQVLYGTYHRRIDPGTGKLLVPEQLRADLRTIQLGGFLGAEAIASPETDVGNPAWRQENATGAYTLLVATFENTADFYDRKTAAAEYTQELRRRGYEAYYHHGSVVSEVTVGTFGPDALLEQQTQRVQRDPDSQAPRYAVERTLMSSYSAEVRRLQAKENFAYLLRNLKRVTVQGDSKKFLGSQLVPIQSGREAW